MPVPLAYEQDVVIPGLPLPLMVAASVATGLVVVALLVLISRRRGRVRRHH
jgi:hypothetical protein